MKTVYYKEFDDNDEDYSRSSYWEITYEGKLTVDTIIKLAVMEPWAETKTNWVSLDPNDLWWRFMLWLDAKNTGTLKDFEHTQFKRIAKSDIETGDGRNPRKSGSSTIQLLRLGWKTTSIIS